jgi:diacylglycerol O-acyltransferase
MSYCGTCFVGVNIDTGAIPEPDLLVDCLHSGFGEILAVAGSTGQVTLPSRTS